MHTPWGRGQPIPNTPFRRVISNDTTDNRLVMLAVDMPVGEVVAPHVHGHEDQAIIVVSGTVGATLGDDEFELTAGSVMFVPREVTHGHWNKGDESARVFEIYTPGGFDLLYERVGEIVASGRQPTARRFHTHRCGTSTSLNSDNGDPYITADRLAPTNPIGHYALSLGRARLCSSPLQCSAD